ncbi:MAG TPA: class I adenylate-forming enzyme family protein [Kofleriaceae bacterium]|nr:class I adenylate-forming enzyme family protein [Kofleriaceae bacterium]
MSSVLDDPSLSLGNLLDRAVAIRGKHRFFHVDAAMPYPGLDGTSLSAPEIRDFVNRIGNLLLANGLKRGDRVAIHKMSGPDYVFLALAAIKVGGVAVPVHHNMSREHLGDYIRYTGATFLVTDADMFDTKIRSVDHLPTVKTWLFPELPKGFPRAAVDLSVELPRTSPVLEAVELIPDSPAYLLHTSGTTGFPKAVVTVCDRALLGLREFVKTPFPVGDDRPEVPYGRIEGRIAFGFPFHHLVSNLFVNAALLGNMEIFTHVRTPAESRKPWLCDPDVLLRLIQDEAITFFVAFPEPFHAMYEAGLARYDVSAVKTWICASDAMHDIHLKAYAEAGHHSVFCDLLFTTELGYIALKKPFTAQTPADTKRWLGQGNDIMRTKIADELGKPRRPGEVGRLLANGPTLFRGYWNDHAMYYQSMFDGWYFTGDLAYRDESGHTYHLDREVDMIPTRGGPAYSLLLEEQLMTHPDVGDAAVFRVDHPELGPVPVAIVYARAGHTAVAEEIERWINARVESHAAVRKVLVVEPAEIPRGMTGKVLKRVLRDRHEHIFDR